MVKRYRVKETITQTTVTEYEVIATSKKQAGELYKQGLCLGNYVGGSGSDGLEISEVKNPIKKARGKK